MINPFVLPKNITLLAIRLYQKTLSLDHGPLGRFFPYGYCKFYPTCSEYSYQVVKKHGFIRGLCLSAKRVLKCHPWSKGGNDPVPK